MRCGADFIITFMPLWGGIPVRSYWLRNLRAALVSILCVGRFTGLASAEDTPPITVFVAKKIVTMDPGWPMATAVAVRDGKILSVGSLEDLRPWLQLVPYRIDRTFADKILLPGFIEPHGHPVLGGTSLTRPLLT